MFRLRKVQILLAVEEHFFFFLREKEEEKLRKTEENVLNRNLLSSVSLKTISDLLCTYFQALYKCKFFTM